MSKHLPFLIRMFYLNNITMLQGFFQAFESISFTVFCMAIELIIGRLKSDYRLSRNYLKGIKGDEINLLMVARAWKER